MTVLTMDMRHCMT